MDVNFDEKAQNWDKDSENRRGARLLGEWISDNIEVKKNWKGLDFGSGTGLAGFQFIRKISEMTFSDLSEKMLDQVAAKIRNEGITNGKLLDLSKEKLTGTYDLIIASLVFHHLEDLDKAAADLAGVLSAGGFLCLADLEKEDGFFHPHPVPHKGFDRKEIETLLEKNGVEILSGEVVYSMKRGSVEQPREYPVFIILGRKA